MCEAWNGIQLAQDLSPVAGCFEHDKDLSVIGKEATVGVSAPWSYLFSAPYSEHPRISFVLCVPITGRRYPLCFN